MRVFTLKGMVPTKVQVCLSMYDLSVDARRQKIKVSIPIISKLLNWSTV